MGLLDDPDYQPGYGGLLGPLFYRSPPANDTDLAEQARVAAAAQLARGVRRDNRTYAGGAFQTKSAPFGLAGPGSLNFGTATSPLDLSAFEPAREPEEQGPMPDDVMSAQLARNNAAARLARGVKSVSRTNASPDFVDVAKSAGIGMVNGAVGLAGLLPDSVAKAEDLAGRYIIDPVLHAVLGPPPKLEGNPPFSLNKFLGKDNLQKLIESQTGEFYQPQTRMGRYAETIGELAPLSLGGATLGALRGGFAAIGSRTAAGDLLPAARAGLEKLGRELAVGSVAPGIAIEALKEAAPGTYLDEAVRYGYPTVRRGLPIALAAKRYLGF
ncbi:hypothetical protein [Bradyrhizobium prioriisuperbiae]|uniref:hypothetical protein n=1 Tax=Bradyrhizobium prioriisuperbiae TaxID=2854389 RepID=UPI0028E4110B|nr:hypothetical protein [Bradyrhizobium prioritasuperba]